MELFSDVNPVSGRALIRLLGGALVAAGTLQAVPKGSLSFAIACCCVVAMLNLRGRQQPTKSAPLHQRYPAETAHNTTPSNGAMPDWIREPA